MARFFLSILLMGYIGLCFNATQAQAQNTAQQRRAIEEGIATPLPSSLDSLFPPKTEQPVFLFKMIEMATCFSSIPGDLSENDLQNAQADFEKFKAVYVETAKMVPEWRELLPLDRVTALGKALESGNQNEVTAAFENVGEVCFRCHSINQEKAYYKYHWEDFSALSLEDPVTKRNLTFRELMQHIDVNFVTVTTDVEQNQTENAQRQHQEFRARFQAMREACSACHDTEREYFVDARVQALIDEMGSALTAPTVDPNRVKKLMMDIGETSCFRCHLVHMPSVYAKHRWNQ